MTLSFQSVQNGKQDLAKTLQDEIKELMDSHPQFRESLHAMNDIESPEPLSDQPDEQSDSCGILDMGNPSDALLLFSDSSLVCSQGSSSPSNC